jgi:hypothetical protein
MILHVEKEECTEKEQCTESRGCCNLAWRSNQFRLSSCYLSLGTPILFPVRNLAKGTAVGQSAFTPSCPRARDPLTSKGS